MTGRRRNEILTDEEIRQPFSDEWADRYPPVLTIVEAAALIRISKSTLYEWKSKGRLAGTFRKRGKHILFWRDKLIETIFNGKEW